MTLEERLEALMKQNELLASKIREDSQKNQETQAQNEYLRKQLGLVMETILSTLLLSSRKIPRSSKNRRSSLFCARKPWTCLV